MAASISQRITKCSLINSQIVSLSKHKWACLRWPVDKCVHTSSVRLLLFESDPKAEYKRFRPKPTTKELLRNGLLQIKEEIQMWKEELEETWNQEMPMKGMPGVVYNAFEFKTEKDLSKWIVTSDKDNEEGQSTCEFRINDNNKAVFSGNLCLDPPKDGIVKKTGYCNVRTVRYKKSFQRDSWYEWGMYTHLVMRVRGDGRTYAVNLATSSYFDQTWNDMYSYALFTRGGPYWQYSRIPFSKFFFTSKGRIQDKQHQVPLSKISSLGFTMAERTPGPFSLEIDYIGLEFDPSHTEEFAYEMYKVPGNLVST